MVLVAAVSVAGDRARGFEIDIDNTRSLPVVTEDGVRHDIPRPLRIPAEGPVGIAIVDGSGGYTDRLGDELAIGFLSTAERDMLGVTRMAERLVTELLADGHPTLTTAFDDNSTSFQQRTAVHFQYVSATWEGKTFRKTCPAGCSWPEDIECCEIYGCSGPYKDCIEIVFNIR